MGQGVSSVSSYSDAAGRITSRANSWTMSRRSFCSWLSSKAIMGAPPAANRRGVYLDDVTRLIRCALALALLAISSGAAYAEPEWQLLSQPGTAIVRLWALPDGTLFAADATKALFWSSDRGDSW